MTRRIAITNLSNAVGEDYEITVQGYDGQEYTYTVRPGHTVDFCPDVSKVTFWRGKALGEAKGPHLKEGVQVFPEVKVQWVP